MKREAKEKYAEISEAIEQAEKAELDRILDDIASGSKKRLIRIRNNESDIEMIYLRCRRIAIVLEYFRFRTPKQNAVLKKDCDDVIKMIAFNEYRLNTDKANVFEAADCVLALSDGGIPPMLGDFLPIAFLYFLVASGTNSLARHRRLPNGGAVPSVRPGGWGDSSGPVLDRQ